TRSSDVSGSQTKALPADLLSELDHYKELFSKLKFNYLEQVTKEKFIRAIVEEPPEIIEPDQNVELQSELAQTKDRLQMKKREVEFIVDQLHKCSTDIAYMYKQFMNTLEQAEILPSKTADVQIEMDSLTRFGSPMTLPLSDTIDHFEDVGARILILKRQIDTFVSTVPERSAYLRNLNNEISVRAANKEGLQRFASEAVRMRQGARAAGKADRENTGQWCESIY
ncbi:hypothetical protein EDC01DRAFT_597238, partial [Geopyxis carbonaria]